MRLSARQAEREAHAGQGRRVWHGTEGEKRAGKEHQEWLVSELAARVQSTMHTQRRT